MLAAIFGSSFGSSHSVADSDGWFLRPSGTPTHAGPAVNEHTALELPVVYSAIGIISDGKAQLPIDIGRKVGEKREAVDGHSLDRVLNLRANPYMSAFTLRSTVQSHSLGWGNGYAEIVRNGRGEVVELWPLLPDRTWPVRRDGEVQYRTTIAGKTYVLPQDRILHIPAMGFDGLIGYSPLYMARQGIGLGKALEEHGGKFFANEARSGGFIEYPGKLGDPGRKNLRESVNEQGGLENAHRIKILEEGAKFHATTITPEDAQFLQTRQFQIEEIARLYRIPLFMLQSHAKDTSWGTGIGQMQLGFLQYTLAPWIIRWEQEMSFKLLSEKERADGLYIRHNVAGLLRGDSKSRSEYYTKALSPQSGWMGRNEVRALEDLNPEMELGPGSSAPPGIEVPA